MASKRAGLLATALDAGFDRSRVIPFEHGVRIGCSQCEALAINGVGTHEHGCPNRPRYVECYVCGYDVKVGEVCCQDEAFEGEA